MTKDQQPPTTPLPTQAETATTNGVRHENTDAAKAAKESLAGDAALMDAAARSHGNPAVVHDEGSELVDTDPVFEGNPVIEEKVLLNVHYAFAGGGMAGENLNICSLCSAIVKDTGMDGHTNWHRNGSA